MSYEPSSVPGVSDMASSLNMKIPPHSLKSQKEGGQAEAAKIQGKILSGQDSREG